MEGFWENSDRIAKSLSKRIKIPNTISKNACMKYSLNEFPANRDWANSYNLFNVQAYNI